MHGRPSLSCHFAFMEDKTEMVTSLMPLLRVLRLKADLNSGLPMSYTTTHCLSITLLLGGIAEAQLGDMTELLEHVE